LCVRNDAYPVSLQVRRLYEQLTDAAAETRGLVRVIDESGDDYLYPRELFADLDVPSTVARALAG
jgi:hypothetical protein